MLRARILVSKGATEEGVKTVTAFIELLGYKKVVIKADNEPAIISLRQEAIRKFPHEVVKEMPPKYDSQSNGWIENIVLRIEGMFRTINDGVESKIGRGLSNGRRIIPWLVKHAADLINRYVVQSDGKTAHQKWKGVSFKNVVPEFGERVQYLEAGFNMKAVANG